MATPPPPEYSNGFPSMVDNTWLSNSEFDLGQIASLSETANSSLSSIFGVYDEFALNEDDPLNFEDFDANDFVSNSIGPIVYISIFVAVAVLFTICGIIWCMCNKCICCCKSSFTGRGKNIDELESSDPRYQLRPYYSERNNGKKKSKIGAIIISVFMAIWLIGFLIIIVHVFAVNEKLNESIDNVTGDLDNIKKDIDTYLDTTRKQLRHTFNDGFDTLSRTIMTIWEDCAECQGTSPRDSATLEADITKLIAALNIAPNAYNTENIVSLKSSLNQLYQANPGEQLIKALADSKAELVKNVGELESSLDDVQADMNYTKTDIEDQVEDPLKDANTGLYWGIMLFNLLYCLIFFLVLVGTVLATFGRQNGLKMAGYLCYRIAIVVIFVICILVVAQMLVAFVGAGIVTKVFCPAIRKLEDPVMVVTNTPPVSVRQSEGYEVPKIGDILRKSKANESAYKVFDLIKAYDVSKLDISENFRISIQASNIQITEGPTKAATYSRDLALELSNIEASFSNTSEDISKLITNIRSQMNTLKSLDTRALETRQNPIEDTINLIIGEVDTYENYVKSTVEDNTGNAAPAYNAINSTISIFCYKVVAPIAGYWFILQFLLPTFILIFVTALFFERIHF